MRPHQPVSLLEVATGRATEAELRFEITDEDLGQWDTDWRAALAAELRRLRDSGVPRNRWPQSSHWDWERKLSGIRGLMAYPTFAIHVGGKLQGMMQVYLTKTARAPGQEGKPLVYVEYLEAAPWNSPMSCGQPIYRGIGSILIKAAIQCSYEEEYKGRIGLHSLPQAEVFYRDTCRMTDFGQDAKHHNLRYFEMTPDQAIAFVNGGRP